MAIQFMCPAVYGQVYMGAELTDTQNNPKGLYTYFEKDYEWWVEIIAATKGIIVVQIATYQPPFRYIQDLENTTLKNGGVKRGKASVATDINLTPPLPNVEKKDSSLKRPPKKMEGEDFEEENRDGVKLKKIVVVNQNQQEEEISPEEDKVQVEVRCKKMDRGNLEKEQESYIEKKNIEAASKESEAQVNIQQNIRRIIAKKNIGEKRKNGGDSSQTIIMASEHDILLSNKDIVSEAGENQKYTAEKVENISLGWYASPNYVYTGDPSFFDDKVATGIEQAATLVTKLFAKFFNFLKWVKDGGWLIFLIFSIIFFPFLLLLKKE